MYNTSDNVNNTFTNVSVHTVYTMYIYIRNTIHVTIFACAQAVFSDQEYIFYTLLTSANVMSSILYMYMYMYCMCIYL